LGVVYDHQAGKDEGGSSGEKRRSMGRIIKCVLLRKKKREGRIAIGKRVEKYFNKEDIVLQEGLT